jgi:ribonuclease HII
MITVGIDEVGRGALAGPVVACAVILPRGFKSEVVIDSKKIRPDKRVVVAKFLRENLVDYGIGVVCPLMIDKINILRATKHAMHLALSAIKSKYDFVCIDAVFLNNLLTPSISPFKGEDKYIEIAAASILAKVYRDNLLESLHLKFPHYDWANNKGYGTKKHLDSIKEYGITPLHRRTFLKQYVQ